MHTAIPYRASTGPEQGFPCEDFPYREKPFFITGNPFSHCGKNFPGKTLFSLQGRVCSALKSFTYKLEHSRIFLDFSGFFL